MPEDKAKQPKKKQSKQRAKIHNRWWFILLIVCIALVYYSIQIVLLVVILPTDFLSDLQIFPTDDKLEVVKEELEDDNPYIVVQTGTIQNNRDYDMSYARVVYRAYSHVNSTVGTCTATTDRIRANGKWDFRAICPSGTRFTDLESLTGY